MEKKIQKLQCVRENSHQQVKISHGDQLQMCLSITQSVWERMKREFIHLVGCVWRRLQRAKEKKIRNHFNYFYDRRRGRNKLYLFYFIRAVCEITNESDTKEKLFFSSLSGAKKQVIARRGRKIAHMLLNGGPNLKMNLNFCLYFVSAYARF